MSRTFLPEVCGTGNPKDQKPGPLPIFGSVNPPTDGVVEGKEFVERLWLHV